MLLFSYLCIFDVIAWSVVSLEPIACSFLYKHVRVSSDDFVYCCSDLVYDLLSVLSERLTELDVSTVLTILQCM